MQLAIGDILEGKVTGITKFGAFVELGEGKTGMVHISEVSTDYVEDISQYLKKDQVVKVKVINITDEGKISLSIKKARRCPARSARSRTRRRDAVPAPEIIPGILAASVMKTNARSVLSRSAAMSGIRTATRMLPLRICSTSLNRPATTRCPT